MSDSLYASNPFSPITGVVPGSFAGRDLLIRNLTEALQSPDPSIELLGALIGPTGSGKTSFLNHAESIAREGSWLTGLVTCSDHLIDDAFDLLAKQAESKGIDLSLDDTANCRLRLSLYAERAQEAGLGLFLAVDDVYGECEALLELSDAVSHVVSKGGRVAYLVSGESYAFDAVAQRHGCSFLGSLPRNVLDAIDSDAVSEYLNALIKASGRSISPNSLSLAADATGGYALMIQLVGYHIWRQHPDQERISRDDVRSGIDLASRDFYDRAIRRTLLDLSDKDRAFLQAMAQADGPSKMSDVASSLGVSTGYARMYKKRLADRGLVYSPRRGYVDYVLPFVREQIAD